MTPIIFLVIIAQGLPQFIMPMRSADFCLSNARQLTAMLKPAEGMYVGCFDGLAQAFVSPSRPQQPASPRDQEMVD